MRTDEATVALASRLATHYSDAVIAGILNRQGRTSAHGHRFAANIVGNLRRHPCFDPPASSQRGELVNVRQAATILGVASSTMHRWLNDGLIPGEQLTPAAPWRIPSPTSYAPASSTNPARALSLFRSPRRLGISRQAVWQRVKRGDLEAIHVRRGREKGLRIKLMEDHTDIFQQAS